MKQYFKIFFLTIIFFCKTINIFAQEDSLFTLKRDVLNFEDLSQDNKAEIEIVSASRSAKKIEDLPVSVYVITREEIQKNGYVTLVDILKSVPGFRVSQPGSGADGETFLMRGLQGNYYTKILINNIPITPSVTGSLAIGAQLPIRQAERIEIIFGPASAVYGADATSGVINIITKESENFNFAQADIVSGDNEYSYLNFTVGGKTGMNYNILHYVFYGSHQQFGNMNIIHEKSNVYFPMHYFNEYQSEKVNKLLNIMQLTDASQINAENLALLGLDEATVKYMLYYTQYSGSFYMPTISKISQQSESIGLQLKFKTLTFGYNYMYRKDCSSLGLTPFLYRYEDPRNFIANSSHIISLQNNKTYNKINLTTNLSYLKYHLDNYSSYGINYLKNYDINDVYVYEASDDINFEQLITYTPNPKIEIIGGLSYQYMGNLPTTNFLLQPFDVSLYKPFAKTVDYNDPIFGTFGIHPKLITNKGAFIQGYFVWKRFTFIVGGRYDKNSEYGKSQNPRYAILYKLNQRLIFRSSSAKSFKAPSENKEYYSIATQSGANLDSIMYAFVPNSLQPEIFKSNEFGLKYKISDNLLLDFCFYNNTITNMIMINSLPSDSFNLPLMVENNHKNDIRKFENMKDVFVLINGTQTSLYFKNIDLHFNTSFGKEVAADLFNSDTINISFADTILKSIRMLPHFVMQCNFSLQPTKNINIRIENLLLSSWKKAYIPINKIEDPYYEIKGYYNLDLIINYKLGKNFNFYAKILNVFNSEYGGIDATRTDIDLLYNPQYKRNIRFGINYRLE